MRILSKYDRRIWVIFVARMVTAFGFAAAMPYLSLYFHDELGVPMRVVGLIMMLSAATGAFAQVWGGEISDRLGRKSVMVLSIVVRGLAFLVVAYLIHVRSNYLVVALCLLINSFIGSIFMPASNAMVADVADAKIRVEAYGLIRIGANAGWAIGPALGGFLAGFSYASLFVITACCCLIAGLLINFFTAESLSGKPGGEPGFKDIIAITRDRTFMRLCLFGAVIFVVMGQLVSPLSVYAVDRVGISKLQLGYLFSLNGLLIVLLQYPATRLVKPQHLKKFLVASCLAYGVGYLSVGFAQSMVALMVSIFIVTLGEMFNAPSITALASQLAPQDQRGRYMGFFGLSEMLGWSLGPLVGGILLDLIPGRSMLIWAFIALLSLIAARGFAGMRKIRGPGES